jgi:hypothetical protein
VKVEPEEIISEGVTEPCTEAGEPDSVQETQEVEEKP